MAQKKKLQVFVSSTYDDLKEERQAAVEAILAAGHIPAGMELFAAGDQSQMDVIKRWINDSDVFLLILGGRYGSIEPTSQKSYIHLEYEYALEQNKPYFAVVIRDDHLEKKLSKHGSQIIERQFPQKLREFKDIVVSRVVRFWSNPLEIKLAIHETMGDFSDRPDVVGWVRANEAINTGQVLEEVTRLTRVNAMLQEQLENTSKQAPLYNGLSYDDMYNLLSRDELHGGQYSGDLREELENIVSIFGDEYLSYIHVFFLLRKFLLRRDGKYQNLISSVAGNMLIGYGLVEIEGGRMDLTDEGRKFLMRMLTEDKAKQAEIRGF